MLARAIYSDLAGANVLVTGGADGIGKAIVVAFAAQGARVTFVDIDAEKGNTLANSLVPTAGGSVVFTQLDLRDIGAIKAGIGALERERGPFAVLVNNAARDDRHAFNEVTPEYWDERFATNLRHMMFVSQTVAPGMRKMRRGSIINLGSVSWMLAQGSMIAYTTAKSAVRGLTRSLARELGPDGIRVNCVVPGWVMTERQRALWVTPQELAKTLDRQCLKVEIMAEHIAEMVLFLASDVSVVCTAQQFIVDAGVT
jgi:NAD(P)-dependent dehydrogenase (short-subunit alcohol dehydrogenase family)